MVAVVLYKLSVKHTLQGRVVTFIFFLSRVTAVVSQMATNVNASSICCLLVEQQVLGGQQGK